MPVVNTAAMCAREKMREKSFGRAFWMLASLAVMLLVPISMCVWFGVWPNVLDVLAGLLGGAVTAYAAMFAMKFRTDDPLPMIALPLLAAVNILLAVALIRGTAVAFA